MIFIVDREGSNNNFKSKLQIPINLSAYLNDKNTTYRAFHRTVMQNI